MVWLLLFQSYLSNRRQYVEIYEMQSQILPVKIGVPLGSILRRLLFAIYINDFPQVSNIFNFIIGYKYFLRHSWRTD